MRTLRIVALLSLLLVGNDLWAQKSKSANSLQAGLKGEYFDGPNFERKVMTRIDPQVDFNWNWQSPGPGVPREYFSVRWTGKLYTPTSGKYRFSATVDDGVRVWVNGKKVIDEWRKQDDSNFVGEITLNGHQLYDLRIEYYNDWKGSVISVFWESPEDRRLFSFTSTPRSPIPAKYLFSKPVTPPVVARPIPKLVAPTAVSRSTPSPAKPVALNSASKPTKRTLTAPASASVVLPQLPKPTLVSVTPSAVSSPASTVTDQPFDHLKTGDIVVLQHVLFAQSDYTLLPESYTELNKFLKALRTRPTLRVEIAGHTDNVGDKRLNLTLSEFRAKVVANYLIRHGIADDRITYKGYGGSRPVVDNGSEMQRAQNRRVEFVVTEQ